MLIKIKKKNGKDREILYFECVYCKVNYKKEEAGIKTISSIDIKIENGAKKENIPMGNNELYINNEKIN